MRETIESEAEKLDKKIADVGNEREKYQTELDAKKYDYTQTGRIIGLKRAIADCDSQLRGLQQRKAASQAAGSGNLRPSSSIFTGSNW
jgi:hypothetical protein